LQVNNPDSTIRFDTYDLAIYKPPINLMKQDITQALPTRIKFTLKLPKPIPVDLKPEERPISE
jgi:hypothetical protein